MGAKRARVAWAVGIGAVLGAYSLAACEGDDTNPARPNPNSSSSGGTDATTGEGGDGVDSGTVDPAVCSRYGGYTGVQSIAADILTAVKADCRISADFDNPESGINHVQQCLEKQLGTYFGCPGVVYDKDTAGKPCRSMAEAHKNLGLRLADFTAFISDTNGVLKAHSLLDSDRQAILAAMNGTQASIVQRGGPGNSNCSCPNLTLPDGGYCGIPDAGHDAGHDAGQDSGGDSGTIADAADDSG